MSLDDALAAVLLMIAAVSSGLESYPSLYKNRNIVVEAFYAPVVRSVVASTTWLLCVAVF